MNEIKVKLLEKIANTLLPEKGEESRVEFIDKRLLATPSIAIAECDFASVKMAHIAKETILLCNSMYLRSSMHISDSSPKPLMTRWASTV